MGSGQDLWARAKHLIPGGNMLLSKRPEMFLPEHWPAYFSRAKGCRVWDLDERELIDMTIMGVGANILGYGDERVDRAVIGTVARGNMSTLNAPEEVTLAERLVAMHPWADMARFARTGGEVNAVAIRIARAASGRDAVAISGYHGWHDWYLATNLADAEGLSQHLLPGLDPAGVPEDLRGSVLPFALGDLEALRRHVATGRVGAIMMEVSRNSDPPTGYLEEVRRIASANGIVLIFDECTSGFRQSFGGLHKLYDVEPDMATFGKALGNGYAVTAVIGRREVMEAAQGSFISSTFWTERIGSAAAVATLDAMEETRSWEVITATGREITRRWHDLAKRHGLTVSTFGLPALTGFSVGGDDALACKTLITQEMLKKGWLATTTVYTCTAHSPEIVDRYFADLDPIFGLIAQHDGGRDVARLLEGPVCHAGFSRLN